jgi:hypothetical protein
MQIVLSTPDKVWNYPSYEEAVEAGDATNDNYFIFEIKDGLPNIRRTVVYRKVKGQNGRYTTLKDIKE